MQSSNSTSHLHFHGQDRLNISSDEKQFKEYVILILNYSYRSSPLRDFNRNTDSNNKLFRHPNLSSTSTLYSRLGGAGGKFDAHSASTSSLPDAAIDPSQQFVWAWGAN